MGLTGKMLDIYPSFPDRGVHYGTQINLKRWKQTAYQKAYGFPEQGLAFSFHDFGNPNVLGYGIGLQYQLTFLQQLSSKWSLTEAVQFGGVYNSHPYHIIDNPQNIVLGTHFSALMTAQVGMRYQINPQWYANINGGLWHSSNGHTGLPNVGMNSLLLGFGVGYGLQAPSSSTSDSLNLANKWGFILLGSYGINEAGGTTRPTNGGLYSKQLIGIGATYRFRNIHRLSLTLEGYYDQTYQLWNKSQEWNNYGTFIDASAVMLMLGHEFIYGHFGLLINAGINLYNPTLKRIEDLKDNPSLSGQTKHLFPGRFAIRYYPWLPENHTHAPFVQAGIKSNLGQADFLELGIGWLISAPQD